MTEPSVPQSDVPHVPGVEGPQLFGHPSTWPQVNAATMEPAPAPVVPGRRKMSGLWIALAGACANHGVVIPKLTEMSDQ